MGVGSDHAHGFGHLALVLHAHLPFVRHPENPIHLEEDWLFEAIAETYLPLLGVFDRLWDDGLPFHITMSLSPPLLEMLNDDLLRTRFERYLNNLLKLAEEEERRHTDHLEYLARYYKNLFTSLLDRYIYDYDRDLVGQFRKHADRDRLEVMTCAATHGFLPLMKEVPRAVRAQIALAVQTHGRNFGRPPGGIWLPECGYYPGVDAVLADEGLRYFIGETHTVEHAVPRPDHGVFAPIFTPSGVAVFGRDQETAGKVWSSVGGYPGHVDYREFYRDIGYDAPFEHVEAYVQTNGARKMTGIKYHRITGQTPDKALYDPYNASRVTATHAEDFLRGRREQLQRSGHGAPLILAPYDAELFGHWWYEGPQFIEMVLRKAACDDPGFSLTTPTRYLDAHPTQQIAQPNLSTWGAGGYANVWLNFTNDWIYPHLLSMAGEMVDAAELYSHPTADQRRLLDQAARELLLAQSSDWAFIMSNKTTVQYAVKRTNDHIERFRFLLEQLEDVESADWEKVAIIEARDNIFPHIDYRIYA